MDQIGVLVSVELNSGMHFMLGYRIINVVCNGLVFESFGRVAGFVSIALHMCFSFTFYIINPNGLYACVLYKLSRTSNIVKLLNI